MKTCTDEERKLLDRLYLEQPELKDDLDFDWRKNLMSDERLAKIKDKLLIHSPHLTCDEMEIEALFDHISALTAMVRDHQAKKNKATNRS